MSAVQDAVVDPDTVALDWRAIAKAAGDHGVRYRTNRALVQFLTDIAATPTRQAIAAAYEAGATDSHNDWLNGQGERGARISEAALDYADAVLRRPVPKDDELIETLKTVSWLLGDISPDGLVKKQVDAALAKIGGAS